MRPWVIFAAMASLIPVAYAACGNAGTVRDWGLHRAWRVEQDCTHPERPAVLVEVPWTVAEARAPSNRKAEVAVRAATPVVRGGMRVRVIGHEANAELQLTGIALNTAQMGERVAVRAGLSGTILHGRVRGSGVVEMEPERGRE
jgi:hypothetical protein